MSTPKNWPISLPYLKAPLHGKDMSASQTKFLRTQPLHLPSAPASSPATETPCPHVKIQAIQDPLHPACGQHGLFATKNIAPGGLILVYLGRLHGRATTSVESDYDLWLDREMDVATDAAGEGNEARFANDYRGVEGKERANAQFGNVWCERWGEVCVGVWALGGRKKSKDKKKKKKSDGGGIRKGDEILVNYGRGFWEERRKSSYDDVGDDGDGDL